ncbi:ABC transporter ATP-binding protein [Uliginosibacterium gangwonense]|uniref:ABC transporter ATP-binding protein n=1 Tax=Uliginosibacterium gangwonense TaxID=392736 RepID=UPI00037BC83A|nr:oligopeptide/dipeptide ABC transporter ATP-binding protein [Uliginosibacterium gangwonense]
MNQNQDILLEVRNLAKHFSAREGVFGRSIVRAVDGVSFCIRRGSSLGLVGESGSGKTTVGRTVLGLHRRTAGEVLFNNIDIHALKAEQLRTLRPHFQLVFQDPMGSLNPRVRVGDAIGEALLEHKRARADDVRDKVLEVMQICGLAPEHYARYPHEFSGGQRQRIGIARAIALKPELIVADEPVSALDVSIQAQIINLFSDLKEHQGVTFLFISHDLAVVEHLCDDIAVMYLGQIVEMASKEQLFSQPRHPYTQGLLSAIPIADPDQRRSRIILKGEQPNPANPPTGCRFHPRCSFVSEKCVKTAPELRTLPDGHQVRCHLA